ncbi:short-chain dehydrogenase/reductase SDR [Hyaloscypha variabilis F]|uniref:Short-chain dehydrogenase/reductase SDR n=1 Tax=Hyaloscypha variabilis (strain UAMH 11265 / GT02V1 / F) TaxID=1149755 RepID=A0A2J6S4Q4_HYAVF|nr:short-chain dehydrogenase/reductase SDR [Hyaloscypha variabilis F]
MPGLQGKVAIITGASSGIGLETTKAYLASGSSVLGVDISPLPSSLSPSPTFAFHQIDLSLPDAAASVLSSCQKAFGDRVDILLNVAGVMDLNHSVDTLDPAMWERVIKINLTAPVMLMRAVVPGMVERGGGTVVNVCSKAGISGGVAGVAYTASKHGLVGATKNVAFRFRHENIRCNAICPGGVATNIHTSVDLSKMDQKAWNSMLPVMQVHSVDFPKGTRPASHQVSALLFLGSDMSVGINGAILPVDGGWSTI